MQAGNRFLLTSHHQAILNHISVGILNSSEHVLDPKNVYRIKHMA